MSLVLQMEAALADAEAADLAAEIEAKAAQELAAEAAARLKAAQDSTHRVRAALAALLGEPVSGPVLAATAALGETGAGSPPKGSPKKRQKDGVQCPGCGETGTIDRIDGYKGTPYSVIQCRECNWERQA